MNEWIAAAIMLEEDRSRIDVGLSEAIEGHALRIDEHNGKNARR